MDKDTLDRLVQEVADLRGEVAALRAAMISKPDLPALLSEYLATGNPAIQTFQDSVSKVAQDLFAQFTSNRDARGVVFMPEAVSTMIKSLMQGAGSPGAGGGPCGS